MGDPALRHSDDLCRRELRPAAEAARTGVGYVGLMARARSLIRLLRRRPEVADALLAATVAVVAQLEVWTATATDAPRPVLAAAAIVTSGALAWRRSRPLASALATAGTFAAVSVLWRIDGIWLPLTLVISLFSVGLHGTRAEALAGGALAVVAATLSTLQESNENVGQFLENMVFIVLFLLGIPWGAGRALRSRQVRLSLLQDRATALARESEGRARAAVAEERLRIARELHDVVGHSLGVIVVQAGAERATLDEARGSTHETLVAIEQTGREALGEMRRLLDMMRRDDEEVGLAPQPSLDHLGALAEKVRAAGLPVDLRVEGEPRRLPAGVDLSAYRIVQEALTNALKHAGPARARVTVRYAAEGVELEITDDGPGGSEPAGDGGAAHGLVGMRERVALHGGSLRSGARPGGGYGVRVRLPYDARRP
jgi:signal transduction histidine kinase